MTVGCLPLLIALPSSGLYELPTTTLNAVFGGTLAVGSGVAFLGVKLGRHGT